MNTITIEGRSYHVPRCNCGAPELGHSPDCEFILGCDDAREEHKDWKYEQEDPCSQCPPEGGDCGKCEHYDREDENTVTFLGLGFNFDRR